ncbi:MAG: PIN domain-containing protein [Tepidisphaeraceae bacterium]|jgi:predicted nucleic acid-binding protein
MLLDTSGLYCYLDAGDARHGDAVSLLESANVRLTHNYVLAELVALCNARGIDRGVTLGFITALIDDPDVAIVWVGQEQHRSAVELLRARPDKNYSLCDAVSFLVMKRHALTEALSTDRHFEQEGFTRLLRL